MMAPDRKKILTKDDIISRSASWSLGCDNALLEKLEHMSEEVTKASNDIIQECDSLDVDVNLAHARLFNLTNKFLLLSNTQFVENRVQNFQEVEHDNENGRDEAVGFSREEKQTELMNKMKISIRNGVEAATRVNLTPDQNFVFPHVIGSSKFFSSRYVGLVDETIRVPTDQTTVHNQNHDKIESEDYLFKPVQKSSDASSSISQSIVDTDDIVTDEAYEEQKHPSHHVSNHSKSLSNSNTSNNLFNNNKTTVSPSPIFFDEDKYVPNIGEPPPVHLGGGSDSDDDDDFKPISQQPGFIVDEQDEDDIFASCIPSKQGDYVSPFLSHEIKSPYPLEPPPTIITGHSNTQNPDHGATVVSSPTNKSDGYEGKTNNSQDVSYPQNAPFKIPPGAVPVFGVLPKSQNIIPRESTTTTPKFRGEEPEAAKKPLPPRPPFKASNTSAQQTSIKTDDFVSSPKYQSQESLPAPESTSGDSRASRSVKSLFDDSDSEDIFAEHKPATLTQPKPKSIPSARENSKNLKTKSLFEDSDSEDDIFVSRINKNKKSEKTQPSLQDNTLTQAIREPKQSIVATGLFCDDDSDEDILDSLVGTSKLSGSKKDMVDECAIGSSKESSLPSVVNSPVEKNIDNEVATTTNKPELGENETMSKSKIAQIQANLQKEEKKEKADKKIITSKVDVKKLATGLAINPLALKPGAKPKIKHDAKESNVSSDVVGSKEEFDNDTKTLETDVQSNQNPVSPLEKKETLFSGDKDSDAEKSNECDDQTETACDSEASARLTAQNSVKELAASLKINPFALRPQPVSKKDEDSFEVSSPEVDCSGQSEELKEPSETVTCNEEAEEPSEVWELGVDVEKPPELSVLPSILKTRTKITSKRRPPTRNRIHADVKFAESSENIFTRSSSNDYGGDPAEDDKPICGSVDSFLETSKSDIADSEKISDDNREQEETLELKEEQQDNTPADDIINIDGNEKENIGDREISEETKGDKVNAVTNEAVNNHNNSEELFVDEQNNESSQNTETRPTHSENKDNDASSLESSKKPTASLFSDDSDDSDLFNTKTDKNKAIKNMDNSKSVKTSLFGSESSDSDDLFKSTKVSKKLPEKQKTKSEQIDKRPTSRVFAKSVFDNSSDEELFTPKKGK